MVKITKSVRQLIKLEILRTRTPPFRLLRERRDAPRSLTARLVNSWVHGVAVDADQMLIDYVLEAYRAMPNHQDNANARWRHTEAARIPLTPDMVETIRREMQRTGLTADAVCNLATPPLRRSIIINWLSGRLRSVPAAQWNDILDALARAPSVPLVPHRPSLKINHRLPPIADDDLATLAALRREAGVSPAKLLKNAATKPPMLTPEMAARWLTGRTRSADPTHVAYVIQLYRDHVAGMPAPTE
jgi:hypothetical protein